MDEVRHCRWRLVIVYASTDDRKRMQQLGVLMDRIVGYPEPCLVMGDFNDLLHKSEKDGGNVWTANSMRDLQEFHY